MPGHRPRSTRPAAALVAASLVAGALGVALPTSIRAHGSQAMAMAGQTPKVDEMAHDFTLTSIAGDTVSLKDHLGTGPVVLLMMRGWPGYQCPFCTRQFGDYLRNADALAAAGARVIFVYPGPAEGLEAHAKMFAADREMPPHFSFLVDPDYTFTNRYGLRWNAPQETSYPATFVLDRTGTVRFVNVSREHGGRVPVAEVLKAIGMMGTPTRSRRPAEAGRDGWP